MKKKMQRKRTAPLFSVLAISALLAGCADEGADESTPSPEAPEGVAGGLTLEDESAVVASYDSPDGRQIKFVEDEPGFIMVLQAGRIGTQPLASHELIRALDSEAVYERLSGRKAPARLLAASKRSREHTDRAPAPTAAQAREVGTTPSAAGELGVNTQALFDDSWLWDQQECWSGNSRLITHRNSRLEQNMQHNEIRYAEAVVYNTDTVAAVTGSFKIRPFSTWSNGSPYSLDPNHYTTAVFTHHNALREFDAKTYINPHGSAYTACQWAAK